MRTFVALFVAAALPLASAQTFQRLGACPTLGCIFPPDQVEHLAGQHFDVRLEVHAPVNGSEATPAIAGTPDPNFKFTLGKKGAKAESASAFFKVEEPKLENWNFTWFEDLFAEDAGTPSLVKVTSKIYRNVALYEPGEYVATLTYYNGSRTEATWVVRDLPAQKKKPKNVVLFIGDGMTTAMITAARLIAHRMVNGKYQSMMQMDKFPILGHQMTHSLDSFITDSANSATALYSGHKTTVNALNVYADSSKNPNDDPKFETIAEIFRRVIGGAVGIVSTAFIADATPAAMTAHTRLRSQYVTVVDSYLNGVTNYSWVAPVEPDVIFGGGAEQFYPNSASQGKDYYQEFAKDGYNVVLNKTALAATSKDEKTLGIFSVSNLAKWLDRNVYTQNLRNQSNSPTGNKGDAVDQPGLKDMTLKAIDILDARSDDKGWFLMSEAANIDKMMHALDYDRALGDLLEFDDTVRATIEKLEEMGQLEDTLIIVTADHGHGFDVMGSVDTQYLNEQKTNRDKRNAIGTYAKSGMSQYVGGTNKSIQYNEGTNFPATWDPRYTLFQGVAAFPDHREDYQVNKDGPRKPAVNLTKEEDYTANPKDAPNGFIINGTLPVSEDQGVHSLTDVPVYAMGPCQDIFGGTYDSTEVFFHLASCLGLSQYKAENKTTKN